jgi:deazaflavin-dependent oxidoreductase (nitroreductase family)
MWYNSVITWLLRTPLHGILSKHFMLLTVTGNKTGKVYTTPVNYFRQGNTLTIVSLRNRTWWRNLRGGRPVTIRLQGQDMPASGTVFEDDTGVTSQLATYLQRNPQLAKYFSVSLDAGGQPKRDEVARAAKDRVIVQIKLGEK